MKDISAGQVRVLEAIRAYWALRRHSPSVRDLMQALGIKSSNGVIDHLVALQKKGFITRTRGVPRSIVLIESPGLADLPGPGIWSRPQGMRLPQWMAILAVLLREIGLPTRCDQVRGMAYLAMRPTLLAPYLPSHVGAKWLAACGPDIVELDVDELAKAERHLEHSGHILIDRDTDLMAFGRGYGVGAHPWADGRARFVVRTAELDPRIAGGRRAA